MTRRHALRDWPKLQRIFQGTGRVLLLSDYDGTLVPIRPTPAQARLSSKARTILSRLGKTPGVRVGVVSGRALRSVRARVRLPHVIYVGNHGFEIQGPGLRFVHPSATRCRPTLLRIARALRRALRTTRGAFVESKRLTLSIHWRNVPARQAPRVLRIIRQVASPWVRAKRVRLTSGKRVIEVRPPVDWDKGEAIAWMLRQRGVRKSRVCYLGDDRTDEDAFRVVNRHHGISIFVGPTQQRTLARWRLKSAHEVSLFLTQVLRARRTRFLTT